MEGATPQGSGVRGYLLSFATWGLYFALLWPRMLFERADGLYAGWRTVWADWVAHFAYAHVFAYRAAGDWFASNPLFATRPFDYPFLADALSGVLMRAGLGRAAAFVLPSLVASLALVGLLHAFYLLLLRSPGRAWLAQTLFFTNGGIGFLEWASRMVRDPSLALLSVPPREYTWFPNHHILWINIVSSELLPQRALLLGLPLGLAVLIPLWRMRRSGFAGTSNATLCALGVLASLLAVTHMHSYLALVLLCALLFLSDLGNFRRWLLFAAAAAVPSLALFLLFFGEVGGSGFMGWYPGWLANPAEGRSLSLWLFLWLNWGVFLPLALAGMLRFREGRDPLVLGGAILFVACFLFRFQPYTWDNTKLLTWAHLLLCVPAARYLAYLWGERGGAGRAAAAVLFVFAVAAGSLDLWRMLRTDHVAVRMWPREEMVLAEKFRSLSDPDALVLSSDDHHHWVPGLAGRRILMGFRAWLWSYGIDYRSVERDVRSMLRGEPETEALLRRYGVDYVVIGPTERRAFGAQEGYFLERHALLLDEAGYKVFAITPAPTEEIP